MEKWRLITANFVAALGSGWILATGLKLSTFHDKAWGDSILAFLIGSSLSVVLSSYTKAHTLTVPTWIYSTLSLASLLPLVSVWRHLFLFHPYCLVALLSLFFCFTFLARAERMARASKTTFLIFPVELAYSAGNGIALLGLAVFSIQSSNLTISVAVSLCALATVLDIFAYGISDASPVVVSASLSKTDVLPVALEFASLTIATQVAAQMFARQLQNPAPLGAFDIGTTLAPIACTALGLSFIRMPAGTFVRGKNDHHRISATLIVQTIFGLMLLACLTYFASGILSQAVSLLAILCAAFLYEVFCLVRIESIGQTAEGRRAIPVIFSSMAVAATATYSVFLIGDIGPIGILVVLTIAIAMRLIKFRRIEVMAR